MRLILLTGATAVAAGIAMMSPPLTVEASPASHSTIAGHAVSGPPARRVLSAAETRQAAAAGLLPDGTRSVLNIPGPLRYGQFVWNARDVPPGPVTVTVDLHRQLISVFRASNEIGSAVITFGARGMDTPLGQFRVLAKMRNHRSSTYDALMPYTLRLTGDGVSIHGSDVRWGTATHGCIGVPEAFARLLFEQVEVGQPIVIRSSV